MKYLKCDYGGRGKSCQELTATETTETPEDALEPKEGAEAPVIGDKVVTAGFQWIDSEISCEVMKFLPANYMNVPVFLYFV